MSRKKYNIFYKNDIQPVFIYHYRITLFIFYNTFATFNYEQKKWYSVGGKTAFRPAIARGKIFALFTQLATICNHFV